MPVGLLVLRVRKRAASARPNYSGYGSKKVPDRVGRWFAVPAWSITVVVEPPVKIRKSCRVFGKRIGSEAAAAMDDPLLAEADMVSRTVAVRRAGAGSRMPRTTASSLMSGSCLVRSVRQSLRRRCVVAMLVMGIGASSSRPITQQEEHWAWWCSI